jgi:hypothetical protein
MDVLHGRVAWNPNARQRAHDLKSELAGDGSRTCAETRPQMPRAMSAPSTSLDPFFVTCSVTWRWSRQGASFSALPGAVFTILARA